MLENRSLKIFLSLVVLLAGIAGAWAIIVTRPVPATGKPKMEIPSVTVIQAEPQTLRLDVHTQGVVTPRDEIDLISEVAGKIIHLHPNFAVGGFFAKNDLLVTIDPRDYDYAIAEALARIAEAKRQLAMEEAQADQARNEWQELGEGNPTPLAMREPQLAEARAKLKAAEADLAQAKIKRNRCELRAPFAGRFQSRNAGLGQYIQPGEKLARLYSTDAAEIRLPLASGQLAYLELDLGIENPSLRRSGAGIQPAVTYCVPGDASAKTANHPKVVLTAEFAGAMQRWEGRIVRTEGVVDESTGVLYAVAEVCHPYLQINNRPPLLNGLFVQAIVQGKELPNLFALPQIAINVSNEALLVDNKQKLHIRHLDVLRHEPDRILVKGGLNAGERIVTSGIDAPVEGMTVKIDANPSIETPGKLSR